MNVNNDQFFPAKLLLLGEYSVLLGSSALGMPFNYFGASLDFIQHETGDLLANALKSNRQLKVMCDHFEVNSPVFEKFLDLHTLSNDITRGLYLASTIPQRYGLGSSGALCAAIYGTYRIDMNDPLKQEGIKNLAPLRNSFVQMESFFHGKSSGFDPLVSSLKTPLFLGREGEVVPVGFPEWLISGKAVEMLLIDSGQPCSTGPLVANFLAEFVPDGTITSTGYELCNLVNAAIGKFLDSHLGDFLDEINRLSNFQLTKLGHLVPPAFRPLWAEGLQTSMFTLKLSGSGGGGFLMCFTRDKEFTVTYFNKKGIPVIPVRFPELFQGYRKMRN
jgi:mevalonate kinase